MTPLQFKKAREKLGLSVAQMAKALRLKDDKGRYIRYMESGERKISGPITLCLEYMLEHGPKV